MVRRKHDLEVLVVGEWRTDFTLPQYLADITSKFFFQESRYCT